MHWNYEIPILEALACQRLMFSGKQTFNDFRMVLDSDMKVYKLQGLKQYKGKPNQLHLKIRKFFGGKGS